MMNFAAAQEGVRIMGLFDASDVFSRCDGLG